MLAIDPPDTSTPSVLSGSPSSVASHSQTTSSTVVGPEAPAQEAAKMRGWKSFAFEIAELVETAAPGSEA